MQLKDSVLTYFVPTTNTQTEAFLDSYVTEIIESFLTSQGPLYCTDMSLKAIDLHPIPTHQEIIHFTKNLKSTVIDKSSRVGAPEMIGHMTTALPFFHRPLARLLTTLNQNVVKVETSSTFTALEKSTIAMLHELFYNRQKDFYEENFRALDTCLGILCSGGTVANISAMWIARNNALKPHGDFRGVAKEGLVKSLLYYGYNGAVIIGSKLMHYSFAKAADLLGLGEDGLCFVDTGPDFKLNVEKLNAKVQEYESKKILIIAIIGVVGTTETGSIDPLPAMGRIATAHGIHFHIDAAWGGPIVFSPEHSIKLFGIETADSITIDGHKQLYTPIGVGVLLLKSPTAIHAIQKSANYVIRKDSPDLGKFTLEGSRPANVLYLNASLNLLGKDGLASIITRSCALTKQMHKRLQEHPTKAFEVLHEPQMNILLYRYIPKHLRKLKREFTLDEIDLMNQYVIKMHEQQRQPHDERSHGFTSRTNVEFKGVRTEVFRIVIANPLTQWIHIEDLITDQVKLGKRIEDEIKFAEREKYVLEQYGNGERFWKSSPFDL